MDEYKKNNLRLCAVSILFLFFVGLIVIGQSQVSYPSLALMLVGLCGILSLLYLYNRPYIKDMKANQAKERKKSNG